MEDLMKLLSSKTFSEAFSKLKKSPTGIKEVPGLKIEDLNLDGIIPNKGLSIAGAAAPIVGNMIGNVIGKPKVDSGNKNVEIGTKITDSVGAMFGPKGQIVAAVLNVAGKAGTKLENNFKDEFTGEVVTANDGSFKSGMSLQLKNLNPVTRMINTGSLLAKGNFRGVIDSNLGFTNFDKTDDDRIKQLKQNDLLRKTNAYNYEKNKGLALNLRQQQAKSLNNGFGFPTYKAGGIITKGVLHSEYNNLGDKGVPAVPQSLTSYDRKHKLFEVEIGEIIFNKETALKIENLVNNQIKNKNDNNLYELGKLTLLAIKNLDDKTCDSGCKFSVNNKII